MTSANPFDTSYAAANAATGVFNTFSQASVYPIGEYRYWNVEWYVQDNWKVNDRLTLDYGLRFYWVQPQHDEAGLTSNFDAGAVRRRARPCACIARRSSTAPASPATRSPGRRSRRVNIGRIVPNSGNLTNGIGQGGQNGVPDRLDRGQRHPVRAALRPDLRHHRQPVVHLPRRRRRVLRPLRGQHRVRR